MAGTEHGPMRYLAEIFQDMDGGFSSKRTAFLLFVVLFAALAIALFLRAVPAAQVGAVQATQDKLVELIKWMGGFIVAEQGTKFAPNKPGGP